DSLRASADDLTNVRCQGRCARRRGHVPLADRGVRRARHSGPGRRSRRTGRGDGGRAGLASHSGQHPGDRPRCGRAPQIWSRLPGLRPGPLRVRPGRETVAGPWGPSLLHRVLRFSTEVTGFHRIASFAREPRSATMILPLTTYRFPGLTAPRRISGPTRFPSYRATGIWLCVFSLALSGGTWPEAFGAPPPVEIQNVRIGLGAGNAYKLGCWTPVRVQLKAGGQRLSGFMEMVVPDDDGVPTSFRQAVELGPGQSTRLTAYARPGGRDTEFTIRLLDGQGRRLLEAPRSLTMPDPP